MVEPILHIEYNPFYRLFTVV